MRKENIGIIGFGFVGQAIAHGMYLHYNLKVYDKFKEDLDNLEETVNNSKFIFVCVPTPMRSDGSQDLSSIDDVVENIVKIATTKKIIIFKSTIIPGTTRHYAEKYKNHEFVFNPEFLTERQAKLDFLNQARIILGGNPEATSLVKKLYQIKFSHVKIFECDWESAEIVKYMCNCFFSVKLSFLNEIYLLTKHLNIDFENLKDMWLGDMRIGNSHTDVPGHDGMLGWGGKCFKKDINAFIKYVEKEGLNIEMCKAAESVNNKVRLEKDWEKIKGATTKNNYTKK